MRSCEPVAVEGDIVVLGFTHDFHRSRVEEEQSKRDIEEVLSELAGQRYRLRCVLLQQRTVASTPVSPKREVAPSAGPASADDPSVRTAASPSVDSTMIDDPVIRAAIDDLGAVVRQ